MTRISIRHRTKEGGSAVHGVHSDHDATARLQHLCDRGTEAHAELDDGTEVGAVWKNDEGRWCWYFDPEEQA